MAAYTLKKSLGQHFLHDQRIAEKIVKSLVVLEDEQVLEIGPGGGALTRWLLEMENIALKAVEVDREKVDYLIATYPELKNKVIHADFLKTTPPFDGPFYVIGNFPYVISSQILFKLLDWQKQVKSIVGMFQKEVAQRIVASPGNKEYGVLSVLMAAFFRGEYLFEVHENCFTPPPKVKSAVVRFTSIGNYYQLEDIESFTILVKKAFQQRRKILRNPLKPYFCTKFLKEPIFEKRAEELSVAQFVELSKKMSCRKPTGKS